MTLTPMEQATLAALSDEYDDAQNEYSAAHGALQRKVGAAHDALRAQLAETFGVENVWQIEMSDFWTCPTSPTRHCVFVTREYGCRICGDPRERK